MKAIVADDDRISRAVLKRLLSHINVETVEADNGLTALNLIEQVDPDFIVIDLRMPVLSGLEALAAIRQSPTRHDLPVICVSALSTRDQVDGMMALGVADFLVKPINPVEALPRIKEVMIRSANWRQRSREGVINTLMLVDADPNFLAFARPLLEHDFSITEATSSTDGALHFREAVVKPAVVCLGEGLPLISEEVLADVMRTLAIQEGVSAPQIYLLSAREIVDPVKAQRFAGVVRRSFVPAQFMAEFRRVVLGEENLFEKVTGLLHGELRGELESAVQQTIGVMMGRDVVVLDESAETAPETVCARVPMTGSGGAFDVVAEIGSGQAEAAQIASALLRRPVAVEDDASEVMGEVVNTIAGRLRACLQARRVDLRMGMPECTPRAGDAAAEVPELAQRFRCGTGTDFAVRVYLRRGEGGGADAGAGAAPADAVAAAGSVDDALF